MRYFVVVEGQAFEHSIEAGTLEHANAIRLRYIAKGWRKVIWIEARHG